MVQPQVNLNDEREGKIVWTWMNSRDVLFFSSTNEFRP